MGKPKSDEVVKQVGVNLESWYKRNADRIKLIDNLTLDCELCKTKEAKDLIKKEIDLTFKGVRGDLEKVNKQNEGLFKDVEKGERKDIGKQVKETIDKKLTIYNKDNKKVILDGKIEDGVPFLGVKGSF